MASWKGGSRWRWRRRPTWRRRCGGWPWPARLQDRLAEDSPAAEDGVKLLDVLPEVAAAAAAVAAREEVRALGDMWPVGARL